MLLLQMESLLVILIVLELKHFQTSLHQPMVNQPTKTLDHFMVQGNISKLKIKINRLSPFTGYFLVMLHVRMHHVLLLSREQKKVSWLPKLI